MRECLTFVHLSDIHFTGKSGDSCFDLDGDVRHELQRDAVNLVHEVGAVTGILVTGDIGFSGAREEYVKAGTWLAGFTSALKCAEENVWVVPGNHDVDRRVIQKSMTTLMAHDRLRKSSCDEIDTRLRELCDDPVTAGALLEPLRAYNEFAARFQCGITPELPFWERDLPLPGGTVIRLRGLSSVLVSSSYDCRGNLILGTAQASVRREEGVEHVILCHHPPDWFLDHDQVTDQIEAKVRLQLFGHKHSQRLQSINEGVRLTAGAMHPNRSDREWEPLYNLLQLGRLADGALTLRVYSRKWHKQTCHFVQSADPNTGREYFEKVWREPLATAVPQPASSQLVPVPPSAIGLPKSDEHSMNQPRDNSGSVPSLIAIEDPERRLTYRFLTLPFRHQIAIAHTLDLLTDDDRALSDSALFSMLFDRAATKRKLKQLWEEIEARHGERTPRVNPFIGR